MYQKDKRNPLKRNPDWLPHRAAPPPPPPHYYAPHYQYEVRKRRSPFFTCFLLTAAGFIAFLLLASACVLYWNSQIPSSPASGTGARPGPTATWSIALIEAGADQFVWTMCDAPDRNLYCNERMRQNLKEGYICLKQYGRGICEGSYPWLSLGS